MEPFRTATGAAAPFLEPNVNTDVIIRIERLTNEPRAELGRYAFEALRFRPDGSENPDFVLNRPPFRGAPILIAGRNFGCGSSREGAVWAMQGMGLRAVVAESFGDIYYNNCFQNGMLPIVLDAATVSRLAEAAAGGAALTIDLHAQSITAPDGAAIAFVIDPQRRDALLDGVDEIGATLKRTAEIEAWQARDRVDRPWIWNLA